MIIRSNRSPLSISREDVLLTDADIIKRYLGLDKLPCVVSSPLREDDHNPSFSLFERDGTVFWKDFGTGEKGTAVMLMARLWQVNYKEALLKIKLDTQARLPRTDLVRRYRGKIHVTSGSSLKVKVRPWKDWDVEFWKSFGISRKMCEWCNVHPVSHAFFTRKDDEGKEYTIAVPMDKYAYAYFEWKDGKESIKLYQPYSQTMKWLSKHDASVWDLWKQAFLWAEKKSDEILVITSSRKDAMCIWENLKVPAMSLQGEGYVPKPQVMKQVLERFGTVYLWYDNDYSHKDGNPGQDNAAKLIEAYPSLKNVCIPSEWESKDPSDLVKHHGVDALKKVWFSVVGHKKPQ